MPCMLIYLVHVYAVSLDVLLSWVDAQSGHHVLCDLIPLMLWPLYCPMTMGGYLTMSLCALWPNPMCAMIFCCLLLGIACLVCSLTWFIRGPISLAVLGLWVDTQSDNHVLRDLIHECFGPLLPIAENAYLTDLIHTCITASPIILLP